jgi:hypothetical protein
MINTWGVTVSQNQKYALYGPVGSVYGGLSEMYAGDWKPAEPSLISNYLNGLSIVLS